MGWLRTVGKRVALRVSAVVARNELFERYGERPVQPPLAPGSWSNSGEEGVTSDADQQDAADDDDGDPECSTASLQNVHQLLVDGAKVVHHWATWCESCIDEMEAVRQLSIDVKLPIIGLSWDAFEAENAEACLADVRAVAKEHGLQFPQFVLDESPETFFADLKMSFKQVPQTWLVNGAGEIVHRVDGALDEASLADFKRKVELLS